MKIGMLTVIWWIAEKATLIERLRMGLCYVDRHRLYIRSALLYPRADGRRCKVRLKGISWTTLSGCVSEPWATCLSLIQAIEQGKALTLVPDESLQGRLLAGVDDYQP